MPADSSSAPSLSRQLPNGAYAPPTADPTKCHDLDHSRISLVCLIDPDRITNRWLNAYVTDPGQQIKAYPTGAVVFLRSVLHSYSTMTASGRGLPPFLHPLLATPPAVREPLSTCLSLARACENGSDGTDGTDGTDNVVLGLLQNQMAGLVDSHDAFDPPTLLAAFQAYLLYCLLLHFSFAPASQPLLRQAMVDLQALASASCRQGLTCTAEMRHARPPWEDWLVAESKRRTLYTMYLLDSLLLIEDGLDPVLGVELQGLLAPAPRSLWEAPDRLAWETAYNRHLAAWPGPPSQLRIDELWAPSPTEDAPALAQRAQRIHRWLEDVDTYGMMMYTMTSAAHGI